MAEFAARMLPSADELNLTDYYASFSGGDHTLTPLYSITPGEERAQLEAIRKKTRTSSVDMRMAELCTPHCFSASCGLQSGMWQIWGNLIKKPLFKRLFYPHLACGKSYFFVFLICSCAFLKLFFHTLVNLLILYFTLWKTNVKNAKLILLYFYNHPLLEELFCLI